LAPEIRRAQLLDAALDIVNETGFDAVSVGAVAERAGVTRPVVYDMFGDLEGLMLALLEREEDAAMAPLLEIVTTEPGEETDPEQFMVDAIRAFLEAVKANPRTWRLVLMPPRGSSRELRARIQRSRRLLAERITALLDWGVERRGGPVGLDHPLLARMIVAAGEDAARLMLAHPRRYSARRMAGMTNALLALAPPDMERRGEPPPPVPEPVPQPGASALAVPAGQRVPRAVRREQLLNVTLALVAEEGFDALSMEAVARRAGVNRVVVYRSFPNLQLLLVALLRREDRRLRETLDSLLPTAPGGASPGRLLGDSFAKFLGAVVSQPRTWGVALLRPESAPLALQKIVNRRRAQLARRLEPLVRWGLDDAAELDVEILSRMLLSVAEEQGRLALEDPEFPVKRLIESSWVLLEALPL
jgi:AcrR family transcriptional regulator